MPYNAYTNLKHSEYSAKLNSGLHQLLETAHNADVTFAIEGQFIKAHQIILSMFSTYFQELFAANPCQHPIFFMKDVSYPVMKDILRFIYAGEVQIAQEDVPFFVDTANALKVKGLTEMQKSTIFPESLKRKIVAVESASEVHKVQEVVPKDNISKHQLEDTKPQRSPEKVETEKKKKLDVLDNKEKQQTQIEECAQEKPFVVLRHGRICKKLHYGEETEKDGKVGIFGKRVKKARLSHPQSNTINTSKPASEIQKDNTMQSDQLDNISDVQVEGEANNMLQQNIPTEPLNVMQLVKVEMDEGLIDITEPEIQYAVPLQPLQQATGTGTVSKVSKVKVKKETAIKSRNKLIVTDELETVTFLTTRRGGKAIIVGEYHYYRCSGAKQELYSCSHTRIKCNAHVVLSSDGIQFRHMHKPDCCISKNIWKQNHILQKRVYRRLIASK